MHGSAHLFALADSLLGQTDADGLEVSFRGHTKGLTRFANSAVNQNMAESNLCCTCRVAYGQQVGVAASNDCSPEGLTRTLRTAETIARLQKPNPHFPGFPEPSAYTPLTTFHRATADYSPQQRAEDLKRIFTAGDTHALKLAGMYITGSEEYAVANTKGLRAHHAGTNASLAVIALGEDFSGYAQGIDRDIATMNPVAIGEQAIKKAVDGKHPTEVPIGKYDVVLEPSALCELIEWMGYVGLGSRAMEEEQSFLHGHQGQQIMGPNITIRDNAYEGGFTWAFDAEGTPKQNVAFIERGIARDVVHDRISGHRAGKPSTGHMTDQRSTGEGSAPMHLHVDAGTDTYQGLLDKVERGILVTRTHYVNGLLDPPKLQMTGLTRDGAFLIENGKVTKGLKNMRFTDSILAAFNRIEGITKEREACPAWWEAAGSYVVPAVLIRQFDFTGKTDH